MKQLEYPFNVDELMKNRRKLKKELLADGSKRLHKKIAVLGGSTTHDITLFLELFLLNNGIEPEFYESEYNKYYEDGMFGNPELDAFTPDLVYIHTSTRNIGANLPTPADTKEIVDAKLEAEFKRFTALWDRITAKFHCPIIQNNFELPWYRLMGNFDASNYRGKTNFVTRLNQKFYEESEVRPAFYINDINFMASSFGIERWSAPSYWYMYKYIMCTDAIPEFAFNLSNIVKSIYGKNKKALVLDLDNTLWGGVVGDDGVEGIDIGKETHMGQGFYEFQEYLKAHKDLGILLNVASKNDHENAIAGLNHPMGVLRPEDMTIIKANWEAKSQNIQAIAKELNIGKDALVFVDDNPAEREIVRSYVPEVSVPEVNAVEEYIHTLDRSGFFEVTSFSQDDLARNAMYKANIERTQAEASFTDYGEYLTSLDMTADIKDFEPIFLERITQLTNKSNQFNLTTKRYTVAEMEETFASPDYIRLYGRLSDKFGDNGIVSVVIGKKQGTELHMDLWLMSCRVLKRDMEFAMLDTLVDESRKCGITDIYGYYLPTAKNHMVEKLYEDFGFTLVSTDEQGNTKWNLKVEGYQKQNRYIKVN